jgi:hypothetical protein
VQGELVLAAGASPALIGSAWDSWSSNPYLELQQVEEQPGFYPFEETQTRQFHGRCARHRRP